MRNQYKEQGKEYTRDDIYFKTKLSDEDILKLGGLVEELEKLEKKFDFSPAGDMYDIPDMDAFIKTIKYSIYPVKREPVMALSFLILRFLTGCKAYWNDINAFEVGCE